MSASMPVNEGRVSAQTAFHVELLKFGDINTILLSSRSRLVCQKVAQANHWNS